MKHNPIITAMKEGGFSSTFVKRPVLTVVLNLLIILAGVAAYFGVEVRELPSIDQPVITVRTGYTGATPDTIDKQITGLVEGAVARTSGLTDISSVSVQGQSRVTLEFSTKTDINAAASDLRDAVGNVRGLPRDDNLTPPSIVKADTSSDAIMQVMATAPPTMSIQDLTQMVNDRILNKLAAVDGVADVQLFGNRNPLVRIMFDPAKLAARSLTVTDLSNAVANIAIDAPAGNVSDANRTLVVRTDNTAKTAEDIGNVPVNKSTKVSDVADVIFGPDDNTAAVRLNGKLGVSMGIVRQAKSNTLSISNGVRKVVADLNTQLPDGVQLRITSDDAIFIKGSVEEVLLTLGIAIGIVLVIIYIFLRSLRVTFIPMVTVPIALTGALGAIWASGFSINLLTLLALVLATGLVVDDAIVVIENIIRRRNEGMGPRAAAVLGTKQVFFAVIATTATLVAVFVPISFLPGIAGKLFREFGFVLAFSVMLSAFVALTLVPMLASRLIGNEERKSRNPVNALVVGLGNFILRLYKVALNAALAAPIVVLMLAFIFAGAAFVSFKSLNQELSPLDDRGVIQVFVGAPQGATVDYTSDQMKQVEAIARQLVDKGEATDIFSISQGFGGGGFLTITLAPWGERTRTQAQISADLNRQLQSVVGVQAAARPPNSLGLRGGGNGLAFAITGSDYGALSDAAGDLLKVMQADKMFDNPRQNFDLTQAQIKLVVNRQRAAELGISVDAVTTIVNTILSGRNIGNFFIGETAVRIRVLAPDGMIQDPTALDNIQVRIGGQPGAATAKMVPLSSLVSFQEISAAPQLPRQDQHAAVPMQSGLGEGVSMGTAIAHLNEVAKANLPAGMTITYTGEAKTLLQTSGGVLQTFGFAVLVVLLVLAAQFESFMSALILFATVPFGLGAAVFAMVLSHGTLNIYSEIGLVMLVGLMSKNGILIVEFANQLREEGQTVGEAIRNACMIRIRPVVMTLLATVFGATPLIIQGGPGAEARHALGWVIVGGLGFATIFTLFLTPVVFNLLAGFDKPRTAEEHRLAKELAEAGAPKAARAPRPEFIPAPGEEEGLPIAAE